MTIARKWVSQITEIILESGAKRVTKYVGPTLTLKATLQGKTRKSDPSKTIVLTIGRPNYTERQFIKKCKAAGEPFPVKKLQIKWPRNATKPA